MIHIYLISVDYKNYLAGELMSESEKKLEAVDEYYKLTPKQVYRAYDEEFTKLLEKYNNPAAHDALTSAQAKVDQATTKMQANLTTALENTQDLEVSIQPLQSNHSNLFRVFR